MAVFEVILLSVLAIGHVRSQRFTGDACFHQQLSQSGVCKSIGNCPSALANLQSSILPQPCGFEGTSPVVCCPSDETTTTTTTSTTTQSSVIEKGPKNVGLKSEQKCGEWAKLVNVTYRVPTLAGSPPQYRVRNECGFKVIQLIVGGTKAKDREFPHMAAIGYDSGAGGRVYVCGGSLISESFVVTAGHCLFTRDYGNAKYVRVGDLDLIKEDDLAFPQEIDIKEIIPHPEYRQPSQYNDIGLLRLAKPVEFNAYVRPICLNTQKMAITRRVIATGWGNTQFLGNTSDHLLKVTLEYFDFDECSASYEVNKRKLAQGIVDDTQVCAGSKSEQKDTCQGDSGGPLQIYDEVNYCMYDLVGITSFGKACGIARTPGIYTRVSHYIGWIEQTVWP